MNIDAEVLKTSKQTNKQKPQETKFSIILKHKHGNTMQP